METNPVKAIRAYCLGCCLEQAAEVRLCPDEDCPLHAFRFGRNPYYKKSEAQIAAARKNLERINAAKNAPKSGEENA